MSLAAPSNHASLAKSATDAGGTFADADELSGVMRRDCGTQAQDTYPPTDAKRLRALLRDDRRDAGEARTESSSVGPLPTGSYQTPWSLIWRDYRRDHRRGLRRMKLGAGVAALVGISCLLLAWRGDQAVANFASKEPAKAVASAPAAVSSMAKQQSPAAVVNAAIREEQPPAQPSSGAEVAASEVDSRRELSTHMRLVRADALLRHPSARAAQEARALLEQTLPEVPRDAHGRAALAEACMRLGDESCARSAMDAALALRPRRSRYRKLAQRVESTFSTTTPQAN